MKNFAGGTAVYSRLARLRKTVALRNLSSETKLNITDFVMPYFVVNGKGRREIIPSMPGIYRYSPDMLVEEVKRLKGAGVGAVLIFGVPDEKFRIGIREKKLFDCVKKNFGITPKHTAQFTSEIFESGGVVQTAVRQLRKTFSPDELTIITDVCVCAYTTHGHCGLIDEKSGVGRWLNNDATLGLLSAMAVAHARAGADIVAPSAMADGQVLAIRRMLDYFGFKDTAIMGYSAKYASSFYGPFRDAAKSPPRFGDRKSYQMDPRNLHEALREIETDIKEGADIIMVKPALSYLDVIRAAKENFPSSPPLAAYNVSGEYSMVKSAAREGFLDEKKAALEILTSIKRAGADIIITYWAKDIALGKWLLNSKEIF